MFVALPLLCWTLCWVKRSLSLPPLLLLLLLPSFEAMLTWSQFPPNTGELAVHTTPNQIYIVVKK